MPSPLSSAPSVSPNTSDSQADDDFLASAKKRFESCAQAWQEIRKESAECWNFRLGDQWPSDIYQRRTGEGRPCITVNWTDQFVLHVANQQRQNEPEVKFKPISSGVDESKAKMRQALYRHVNDFSQADTARDNGFIQAVTGGVGYWRVTTELVDESLNMQEVCIREIEDCFTVYMDPKPKRLQDIRYPQFCFIVEDISWADFKAEYGSDSSVVSGIESWQNASLKAGDGWVTKDTVRLVEYFYIDPKDKMCKWARLSAFQVHERRDIGIKFIPIIEDRGEEIVVDGKRRMRGIVWNIRDCQQTLNYATSALSEAAGMGPKVPYLVTPKMIEGLENFWGKLNSGNLSHLPFNPDLEFPQGPVRQSQDIPIQAMVLWRQQAVEDFRQLTGIYAASQGAPSNEISGKAINARKVEGELAVYHFVDNHSRAMTYESQVVNALMKIVYDVPRVLRITQPDNTSMATIIGNIWTDETRSQMHPNVEAMTEEELAQVTRHDGSLRYYDPTEGDYDTVVEIGPSATTARRESTEGMALFAQAAPELVPRYADIYVRNQDWVGKDEIADRLVPPDVAQRLQAGADPATQAAALSAQLTQLKQQHQLAMAELQKLQMERAGKVQETQGRAQIAAQENQAKLQTVAMQTHAQLVGKLIEANTDISLAAAERQMERLKHFSNLAQEQWTHASDQAHEHAMREVEAAHSKQSLADAAALTPKPDEAAWTQ